MTVKSGVCLLTEPAPLFRCVPRLLYTSPPNTPLPHLLVTPLSTIESLQRVKIDVSTSDPYTRAHSAIATLPPATDNRATATYRALVHDAHLAASLGRIDGHCDPSGPK